VLSASKNTNMGSIGGSSALAYPGRQLGDSVAGLPPSLFKVPDCRVLKVLSFVESALAFIKILIEVALDCPVPDMAASVRYRFTQFGLFLSEMGARANVSRG
jgi:hypothetical protein